DAGRALRVGPEAPAEGVAVGELARDELQRHDAPEPRMGRAVDDPHAPRARDPLDPIAGEVGADGQVGLLVRGPDGHVSKDASTARFLPVPCVTQPQRPRRVLASPAMLISEYQELSRRTATYPGAGDNIVYPTLGLAGEAGEVAEKVKKLMR